MKKNTLILYSNQKDIPSIARKEFLFKSVLASMIGEGRAVERTQDDTRGRTVTFSDGSKLLLYSFGNTLKGHRLTHVYIDHEAMAMTNSENYISTCVLPFVLKVKETFDEMDIREELNKRIQVYSLSDPRKFSLEPYFKA